MSDEVRNEVAETSVSLKQALINHRRLVGTKAARKRENGSAVLIVLLLLAMVGTLAVSNAVTLRRLKVELQLLEQQQQARWVAGARFAPPVGK